MVDAGSPMAIVPLLAVPQARLDLVDKSHMLALLLSSIFAGLAARLAILEQA